MNRKKIIRKKSRKFSTAVKSKIQKIKYTLCARTFHTDSPTSVNFSPNGLSFISGSLDNTIKLWSIYGSSIKTFRGHTDFVTSVNFSPDGLSFISGSVDKTIKLWSIDGSLIRTFNGHADRVKSVNFSPDGLSFISGSIGTSWYITRFPTGTNDTIKLWRSSSEVLRSQLMNSALKGKKTPKKPGNNYLLNDLPYDIFDYISEFF